MHSYRTKKLITTAQTAEDRVQDIVETVIPNDVVYVVETRLRGREGSKVVEVFLDSDGGISVDDLARYSREIGFLLEASDVVKGRYRLNVSSPGADRPLKLPRQYRKHVGRPLAVETLDGRTLQGVLESADAENVTLRNGSHEVRVAFAEIQEAKVELPW